MRKFLDDDGKIVIEDELKTVWSDFTEEEKAEYNNNFGNYLACCLVRNGGILTEVKE